MFWGVIIVFSIFSRQVFRGGRQSESATGGNDEGSRFPGYREKGSDCDGGYCREEWNLKSDFVPATGMSTRHGSSQNNPSFHSEYTTERNQIYPIMWFF